MSADLHHETQLPIVSRLLDDRFNISESHIERKAKTGETPDVFSVIERSFRWDNKPGKPDAISGSTVVSEYKSTVSDLRKDASKPFRTGEKLGVGDWRLYWFRKDGEVRPEHVDETGWGVVMFDDIDAELVREPTRCNYVHTWAQNLLIVQAKGREARLGKDAPLSSRRPKTRHAASKDVDRAVELIKQGPMSYAQIRRELGLKGTALLRDLERDNRIQQDGPGGNFYIKDEVANA